jgi:hypothetical protein
MRWFLCYANVYEVQGVRILMGEWRRIGFDGGIKPTKFGSKRIRCKLEDVAANLCPGGIHRVHPTTKAFLANAATGKL